MKRGVPNIIIGGLLVAGGLSGKVVLIGTNSSVALAILGGIIVVAGIIRLANA